MNILKRTKRMWELANKDTKALEELTQEQVDGLPDDDQQAVFLGEGTHDEWLKQERADKGLTNIFDIDND